MNTNYLPPEFMHHPKVQQARKLLFEAEKELLSKEKAERGNDFCECKHPRKVHGPSHSINYTEGACHKCDCLNFLMSR